MHHFKCVELGSANQKTTKADLDLVHNLAQFCHCIAQGSAVAYHLGKIGSGFDVSAAVYGSQVSCVF